jgi:hypothetical protein
MTQKEALRIVFDLAQENSLDLDTAHQEGQLKEWHKQQKALGIVLLMCEP